MVRICVICFGIFCIRGHIPNISPRGLKFVYIKWLGILYLLLFCFETWDKYANDLCRHGFARRWCLQNFKGVLTSEFITFCTGDVICILGHCLLYNVWWNEYPVILWHSVDFCASCTALYRPKSDSPTFDGPRRAQTREIIQPHLPFGGDVWGKF